MKGDRSLDDQEIILNVQEIMIDYNCDRDGGFFGVLAQRFENNLDGRSAVLCFVLSIRSDDEELSDNVKNRYESEMFPILQAAARSGLYVDDSASLIRECLEFTKSDPVCQAIAACLSCSEGLLKNYAVIHRSLISKDGYVAWFTDYYQEKGDNIAAEKVILKGLSCNPANGHLLARLALLYAKSGRKNECSATAVLACQTSEGWVQFLAGKAFLQIEQLEQAERAFRRAIELYPADPDYSMELSHVLLRLQRHDEAVQIAYEAADRSPKHMAHRHNSLGIILRNVGRLKEAEAAFREALRRNPAWDDVRVQLEQLSLVEEGDS